MLSGALIGGAPPGDAKNPQVPRQRECTWLVETMLFGWPAEEHLIPLLSDEVSLTSPVTQHRPPIRSGDDAGGNDGSLRIRHNEVAERWAHDMGRREEVAILLAPLQAQARILHKKIYPA